MFVSYGPIHQYDFWGATKFQHHFYQNEDEYYVIEPLLFRSLERQLLFSYRVICH